MLSLLLACSTDPPPPPPALPAPPQEVEEVAPPPPQKARNLPPTIESITIEPSPLTTTTDALAQVDAQDPERQHVDIDYAWWINDRELLAETSERLPSSYFSKGDAIRLQVTISDGEYDQQREISTTVGNSPPVFVADPRSVKQLDGYALEVTDPDGDDIRFRIEDAPRGMSIHPTQGLLSYKGSADEPGGDYTVKVYAEDEDKAAAIWELNLTVTPGSNVASAQKP